MVSKMYELWEKMQKSSEHREKLRAAYCKSLADEAYAHAEFTVYKLTKELEEGLNQYTYDGAENSFLHKVIKPIYPEIPKSPSVILDPLIEVQVKYNNGKIRQIIRPITAFKIFINPEKINPEEYKF